MCPYTSVAWRQVWPIRLEARAVQPCCKAATICPHEYLAPLLTDTCRSTVQPPGGIATKRSCVLKPEKARMCLETWIKLVLHRPQPTSMPFDCGLCGKPNSRAQSRNAMPLQLLKPSGEKCANRLEPAMEHKTCPWSAARTHITVLRRIHGIDDGRESREGVADGLGEGSGSVASTWK